MESMDGDLPQKELDAERRRYEKRKSRKKAAKLRSNKVSTAPTPSAPPPSDVALDHVWPLLLDIGLASNPLVDKLLGCLYGNALGDAFGLATEFLSKGEIASLYPEDIPFPNFKRNAHNHRWVEGDWTDDTDQLICIMDTIIDTGGSVDMKIFAGKLFDWMNSGFPELGDWSGTGIGGTVGGVLRHPVFLKSPHKAAKSVWKARNRNAAANGAVMRTAILGCINVDDTETVYRNTVEIAKVTHWDPRCVASCVAVTTAISALLVSDEHDLSEVSSLALKWGLKAFDKKEKAAFAGELKSYIVRDGTREELERLELCDPAAFGYTFKCMGAGFWGMHSAQGFKETLTLLVKEGGDADTNGAVCGAMWGARHGFSALPRDWLAALAHKKWFDAKVARLLGVLDPGW